jgi:hypothetical protein
MGQMRTVLEQRRTDLERRKKTGLQMGLEILTLEETIRPGSSVALAERNCSAVRMKRLAQLKTSCPGHSTVDPNHLLVGRLGYRPWRWFGQLRSHRRPQPVRFE